MLELSPDGQAGRSRALHGMALASRADAGAKAPRKRGGNWEVRVHSGWNPETWARGEVRPEAGRQGQLRVDGEASRNTEATEKYGRTVDRRDV